MEGPGKPQPHWISRANVFSEQKLHANRTKRELRVHLVVVGKIRSICRYALLSVRRQTQLTSRCRVSDRRLRHGVFRRPQGALSGRQPLLLTMGPLSHQVSAPFLRTRTFRRVQRGEGASQAAEESMRMAINVYRAGVGLRWAGCCKIQKCSMSRLSRQQKRRLFSS